LDASLVAKERDMEKKERRGVFLAPLDDGGGIWRNVQTEKLARDEEEDEEEGWRSAITDVLTSDGGSHCSF